MLPYEILRREYPEKPPIPGIISLLSPKTRAITQLMRAKFAKTYYADDKECGQDGWRDKNLQPLCQNG
jgi:hypothetical protein